ncbi:hypothetical protein E3T37_06195 [Cryobacterium sp. TMT2-10]|uniref:O-antigen ligase family protein n=1 Tax=Cryobacterium sp. TMT2-10 TaxID=1259244 RepID=UPI00106DBC1F|nr:O-antigen ligase family protein [Cryobacterium sp. TMT2-10]TFD40339.1 hypothetical protein E3T37_06195 [Cryobacterium sp. TMT2-10]
MGVSSLTRRILAPVAMVLVAAGLGWQAAAGPSGLVVLLFAIGGALVALLNSTVRALSPFTLGVLFILASASTFTGSIAQSVGFRIVGIALLCLSGLQKPSDIAGALPNRTRALSDLRMWLPWVTGSLLTFLLLATAFHGQALNFVLYGLGLVMLVVAVVATAVAVPELIVSSAVVLALGTMVVGSIILGLASPGVAIAGGRLRGLASNANLLGFYAFLFGSLAIIVVRHIGLKVILLVLAIMCVVWTSSRASALALVIVIIFGALRRVSATKALWLTGFITLVLVIAIALPQTFSVLDGVLRTDNSRSYSFDGAMGAFRSSPLIGTGLASEEVEIASSPLRALASAGVGGLIAVVVMWGALLFRSRKAGVLAMGFTLAAVVHSCFEGWLLSPVSPLLLIFVLVWWVIVRNEHPTESPHRIWSATPIENRTRS